MKRFYIFTGCIFVAFFVSICVFNNMHRDMMRYDSPEKAFWSSCPKGSEIISCSTQDDISLIVYKKDKYTYIVGFTACDENGWGPVRSDYKTVSYRSEDNLSVYLKSVNNKNVVLVSCSIEGFVGIPHISDNAKSEFCVTSFEFTENTLWVYAFTVMETSFPENYSVFAEEKAVSINHKTGD